MNGRWSDCSARRKIPARFEGFERDKDRDCVIRMRFQIADRADSAFAAENIESPLDGDLDGAVAGETDHSAASRSVYVTRLGFPVKLYDCRWVEHIATRFHGEPPSP
jgi:hypothetical protein